MADIEFTLHRLDNITSSQLNDRVNALQNRYDSQIEDGSGNYTTIVHTGYKIYESTLHDWDNSGESNSDGYDLIDDWRAFVDDNYNRQKWSSHGLVVDFFNMTEYDLSVGGLAPPGGAASSDGAVFWAYNERGIVHEATHTMMDSEHYHHNMGRKDDDGDATAMGVTEGAGNGCSYIRNLPQGDLDPNTTVLGYNTVDAVRTYRDTESYASGMKDCCYTNCTQP